MSSSGSSWRARRLAKTFRWMKRFSHDYTLMSSSMAAEDITIVYLFCLETFFADVSISLLFVGSSCCTLPFDCFFFVGNVQNLIWSNSRNKSELKSSFDTCCCCAQCICFFVHYFESTLSISSENGLLVGFLELALVMAQVYVSRSFIMYCLQKGDNFWCALCQTLAKTFILH